MSSRARSVVVVALAILSGFAVTVVGGAGCSGGAKTLHVSPAGSAVNLQRGGDHVAYILNVGTSTGGTGDLRLASSKGTDVKIASNVTAQGHIMLPDGSAVFYTQLAAGGMDASLSRWDVAKGSAQTVVPSGVPITFVNPMTQMGATYPAPVTSYAFLFPSAKYLLLFLGADVHVLETATGRDVFQRHNAGHYNFLPLPDDTMVFTDSIGGSAGPTGPTPVETLLWVSLPAAASTQPVAFDVRVGTLLSTDDSKAVVYQRVNGELAVWDPEARPAAATTVATAALGFGVCNSSIAYASGDGALHVIGLDGSKKVDVPAAGVDLFSPVIVSADCNDIYFFQKVESQFSRGTLLHVAAAGGTPVTIAAKASTTDVRPVPGALLYLRNVDDAGVLGDAVKAARDGSGGTALGTGVPVGQLTVVIKDGNWFSPHLTKATPVPTQTLADALSPTLGALALTLAGGETKIDPATRNGAFGLADDNETLVFVGGLTFDATSNNYVGKLGWVSTAMPSAAPSIVALDSVSEITDVKKRTLFVNSSGMTAPGVYFVSY